MLLVNAHVPESWQVSANSPYDDFSHKIFFFHLYSLLASAIVSAYLHSLRHVVTNVTGSISEASAQIADVRRSAGCVSGAFRRTLNRETSKSHTRKTYLRRTYGTEPAQLYPCRLQHPASHIYLYRPFTTSSSPSLFPSHLHKLNSQIGARLILARHSRSSSRRTRNNANLSWSWLDVKARPFGP